MREQTTRGNFIRDQKGFTLVELMVVLAILAILSSVAVFSIIGYIDKSRFDRNEQNAQSIYQAVQTALERKKNNGEIEDWILETWIDNEAAAKKHADGYNAQNYDKDTAGTALDDCYDETTFNNFPTATSTVGDSVHMRYTLTYTKDGSGEDNEAIKKLVGGYFYDTTILDATFTIEFDVEKTLGGDEKTVHYTANAYAVFYDEKRAGWDEKAVNGTVSENPRSVPYRDSAYRSDKSLVGYYNGGNPAAVDSVYTPVINNRMEFAELALRNGERLELSFSVYNGNKKITGTTDEEGKPYHIHYTASLYDQYDLNSNGDGKWLADLVISEAYPTQKLTSALDPNIKTDSYADLLYFDAEDFAKGNLKDGQVNATTGAVYSVDTMTDDLQKQFTRYKASIETMALVYVNKTNANFDYNAATQMELGADSNYYWFPMTVSYVVRKYDSGEQKDYVSYTLALDAMMSRKALFEYGKNTATRQYSLSSSITRLLPDTNAAVTTMNIAPKNIYVSMTASVDAFSAEETLEKFNVTTDLPSSGAINAKRAYDDPVYLLENGNYAYSDQKALGDSYGYAVCNTYFGDLGAGSLGNKHDTQLACITSFRHLYNMRFMEKFIPSTIEDTDIVTYEIHRDLNWYTKVGEQYTSDVVVYDIGSDGKLVGHSPSGVRREHITTPLLVSWPAISVIAEKQELVASNNMASSNATDQTSVIRNVQMRRQSFVSTDEGYGFVCKNEGTIRNIRGENFCLTLESVADGETEPSGKSVAETLVRIFKHGDDTNDSFINIDDNKNYKLADGNQMKPYPMGGLIGVQNGMLGVNDQNVSKEENTIRMSNPILLAGIWDGTNWKKFRMYIRKGVSDPDQPAGIGGVIGYYSKEASSAGYIETDGNFAIAGAYYIGGVIGNVHGGVDACLSVDSEKQTAGNAVVFPTNINSLLMGRKYIGGAVGYVVEGYFAQKVPMNQPNYNEGSVSITERADAEYAISVKLAPNSYIWQYGGHKDDAVVGYEGIGGAIGQIYKHDVSKILSIKSINEGYILSSNNSYGRYIGGAVGYIQEGSAKEMYIFAYNTVTGRIGTKDEAINYSTGNKIRGQASSAAAGIAYIKDFGNGADTYVFDVRNDGVICCNFNMGTTSSNVGVGAAIGSYHMTSNTPAYPLIYIRSEGEGVIYAENYVNNQTADQYWKGTQEYCYGAGGAVGYIYGLQNGSHVYSLLKKNAVILANGNNVGGAIGCVRKEVKGASGKIVTVTASICDDVQIKGKGINIGGCVGYLLAQSAYSEIKTQMFGSAEVCGNRNVGGVVGCGQQYGNATGIKMALQRVIPEEEELRGADPIAQLSVKGCTDYSTVKADNKNIGGVIGVIGTYGGAYGVEIKMPTQIGTDMLAMNIAGGKYVGGMTGCMYLHDLKEANQHNGTVAMTGDKSYVVSLHPSTMINGIGQYVGGAIGYVYDDKNELSGASNFAIDVVVTIPANASSQMIKGTEYVGGAIGAVSMPNMTGNITSNIASPNAVAGTALVGGAIGYVNIQTTAGNINSVITASNAVAASSTIQMKKLDATNGAKGTFVGGCVGLLDGSATYGTIVASYDGTGIENFTPLYGPGNYMGGCIGCIGGDDLTPTVLAASTVLKGTAKLITAPENSIIGVGGVAGWVRKGSTVGDVGLILAEDETYAEVKSSISFDIPKADSVGGLVGQITEDSVIAKLTGGVAVDIHAHTYVGGYVGLVKSATLGTPIGNGSISVAASYRNAGGFFGEIDDSTVGIAGEDVTSTNVKLITSADSGDRITGGTGGFAGRIVNASKVNCNIDIELQSDSLIAGGWNIGGVVGFIGEGYMNGNLTTRLDGGKIQGRYGSIGGVIGSIQKGEAGKNLITYVTVAYENSNKMTTAIGGDGQGKGVGGVIGQIGGGKNGEDLESKVILGTLSLNLWQDFVLYSGTTSVGSVVGQCETENGSIHELKIVNDNKSAIHTVKIAPQQGDRYDIGGLVGFMYGKLTGSLTIDEKIEITVSGDHYVGGCFGGMDGILGTEGGTLNVRGIKSITGNGRGVGGLIGAVGVFHGTGDIVGTINIALQNTEIKGGQGVGGAIGCVGDVSGVFKNSENETSFWGNLYATFDGVKISGSNYAGGLFGTTKKGYNWDDIATLSISVVGNSEVTVNNNNTAGGMVGNNESMFLPRTVIKVASGVSYTINAANGTAGGVMGRNVHTYGRSSGDRMVIPQDGGKIIVNASRTGYILGLNESGGKCGTITPDGGNTGGVVVYKINDVEIGSNYDKTEPRVGYVGQNKGSIDDIEIETDDSNDSASTTNTNSAPLMMMAPAITAPISPTPTDGVLDPLTVDEMNDGTVITSPTPVPAAEQDENVVNEQNGQNENADATPLEEATPSEEMTPSEEETPSNGASPSSGAQNDDAPADNDGNEDGGEEVSDNNGNTGEVQNDVNNADNQNDANTADYQETDETDSNNNAGEGDNTDNDGDSNNSANVTQNDVDEPQNSESGNDGGSEETDAGEEQEEDDSEADSDET